MAAVLSGSYRRINGNLKFYEICVNRRGDFEQSVLSVLADAEAYIKVEKQANSSDPPERFSVERAARRRKIRSDRLKDFRAAYRNLICGRD